jgi:hypothetical protein
VVLGGFVGDEGMGGKKFSVSSVSDAAGWWCGIEDGTTVGAGGGSWGIGNSSWAICRLVSAARSVS